MKHVVHVLHWWEWSLNKCSRIFKFSLRNWNATNFRSSEMKAKASASMMAINRACWKGGTLNRGPMPRLTILLRKSPGPVRDEPSVGRKIRMVGVLCTAKQNKDTKLKNNTLTCFFYIFLITSLFIDFNKLVCNFLNYIKLYKLIFISTHIIINIII